MKNDIAALTDQLTDVLNNFAGTAGNEARRGYRQARSNAGSMASDLSDRGREWMSDFSDRGREMASVAQDYASSLEESLEDVIHERPMATLGIALGLGVLIGMAWKR